MRAWSISVLCLLFACDDGQSGQMPNGPFADAMAAGDAAADAATPVDAMPEDAGWQIANRVAATEQPPGDPIAGRHALLHEGYVGCGIPLSAYMRLIGPAPQSARLPDREGVNAQLPYAFTAYTTDNGVEVATANCLGCHAARINGELVVGLGTHASDFTGDTAGQARALGTLIDDPAEHAEWSLWAERVQAIAPFIRTRTIGANPADNLGLVLFAHRDPETLAWSPDPLLPLPPEDPVPVDVPPWWHMKKKTVMYWNAMGEGHFSSLMMTASTLCVDTVAHAERIRTYFADISAYIRTIEPPAWPWAVNAELAEQGRGIFNATCSGCHGTYAPEGSGDADEYPSLWVPIDIIGTDPALANGAVDRAGIYQDWYNASFYGEDAWLDAKRGYIAPPLDGIWATAPYFHNGSVPTIAGVLNSATRPAFWRRSFDSRDYDQAAVGWQHEVLEEGHAGIRVSGNRKYVYDTSFEGYANTGHPFGDGLSDGGRLAVLEYLKTL
ncbi:MAG: mono/diheme cytochrome c family protein [Bradymonadia bacterium]